MKGDGPARLRNWRDIAAGIFFVLVGGAVATLAHSYSIGDPSNPGPGFFPFYLGAVLATLGAGITLVAIVKGPLDEEAHRVEMRGVVGVLGPVIVFGLLLESLGFVVSTIILVMLTSCASRDFDWRRSLLGAGILALIVLVGFAYILRIQIPVWPGMFRDS